MNQSVIILYYIIYMHMISIDYIDRREEGDLFL